MPTISETTIQLIRQLSDGKFHSGQQLAENLGISRTAVWKRIQKLKSSGLEVAAVSGRGYRMVKPLELLDKSLIESHLQAACPQAQIPLEIFSSLPSTNAYLMETAQDKPTGCVCLAEMQTAGKGRLGRRWISPYGVNVYLSMLWRFTSAERVGGLSLAVGVAVVRALLQQGFPQLNLKWPNDILYQARKLGGILVEARVESQGQCMVVAGIGLNLDMPSGASSKIDQPWIDAKALLPDAKPSRNQIIAALICQLMRLLGEYESKGLRFWLEDWRRWNCVLGKEVIVQQGGCQFDAIAEDIADNGQLKLKLPDGRRYLLAAGDIKLRLKGS